MRSLTFKSAAVATMGLVGVIDLLLIAACGQTSFSGGAQPHTPTPASADGTPGADLPPGDQPPGTPDNIDTNITTRKTGVTIDQNSGGHGTGGDQSKQPLRSVQWYLPCASDPGTPPRAASSKNIVLVGAGPFQFTPEQMRGTPLTFSGHLCKPPAVQRDIVFVVDVSGSMTYNDPNIFGNCGRLNALKAVISAIPPTTGRFGIVTFSSDVGQTSSALFDSQDKLFADLASNQNISNMLCAHNGNTNYHAALTQASTLMAMGRPDATKEIYFVSDGEPTAGYDGIAEATALKTQGVNIAGKQMPVTIATVMLNGTDQVMEQSIASRNAKGKPLHTYAANATDLVNALSGLASGANGVLKYRAIGGSAWTEVDLAKYLKAYDFVLPSITIAKEQSSSGFEVVLDTVGLKGQTSSSGGTIIWADGSKGSVVPGALISTATATAASTSTATADGTSTSTSTAVPSAAGTATATSVAASTATDTAAASGQTP